MWVRGLKPLRHPSVRHPIVAPYVGAWIETDETSRQPRQRTVAPYVGAWIETLKYTGNNSPTLGRTLCGCVD